MLPYRKFTLAATAAALAATAIARWNWNDAAVAEPKVQAGRPHKAPAAIDGGGVYLPALFVEEERAAPIEPMPPQF